MSLDFGRNLRVEMSRANMTNLELAAKTRLSKNSITKYRTNETEPGSDAIYKMAKALNCKIADLFAE